MLDAAVETSAASMVDQEIGDLDYSSEGDPPGRNADSGRCRRRAGGTVCQPGHYSGHQPAALPTSTSEPTKNLPVMRRDGILDELYKPPVSGWRHAAARLKIMAQLDIAERRVPQDGRLKLGISPNNGPLIFASTPCPLWGERWCCVCSILQRPDGHSRPRATRNTKRIVSQGHPQTTGNGAGYGPHWQR